MRATITRFVRRCVSGAFPLFLLMKPLIFPGSVAAFAACSLACAIAPVQAGEAARRSYDIAQGDAASTLKRFADESGRQVVYLVDAVRGVTTNPVRGEYTVREALTRLVADTGLVVAEDAKSGALMVNRAENEESPAAKSKSTQAPTTGKNPQASPMKKQNVFSVLGAWLALALAPAAPIHAADSSAASSDEPLVLTPFQVTSEGSDKGYQPADTLAGTRLRTNLKDMGAPITELSSKMLDDLGVSNLNGVAEFLPSVELETSQSFDFAQNTIFYDQSYRIRGLFTDNKARNYFNSPIPSDAYNTSRITLSRGANSILFGAANPAGIFNVSTKDATLAKDASEIQLRTDEYGTERVSFDTNKVLVRNKLSARLVLLSDKTEMWSRPLNYKDQRRAYLAATFRPSNRTTLSGNLEVFDYERSAPSPLIPLDRVNLWIENGRPTRASNTVVAANPAGIINIVGANQVMATLGSLPIGNDPAPVIVQNALRYPVSASRTVGVNNSAAYSLPANFFGGEWPNFGGNDRIDASDGSVGDVTLEHRVVGNLYFQAAVHGEKMHRDLVMPLNDWNLFADASTTLQDGVTPNPNVGRYFVGGGNPFWNSFDYRRTHYRATLSYGLDLTKRSAWFGSHQFAALYQIEDNTTQIIRTTLRNVTPLPGFSPLITNANNQLTTYIYLNPDGSYSGPSRDPRTWPDTFSRNGVTARYFRSTAGTNERVKLRSVLAVMQDHWWKGRLVTTAGVRNDRQDLADANRAAWPTNPATGEFVPPSQYGRVSNPAGSGLQDNTYSVGATFHLLQNWRALDRVSLTYNKSTNFQPAGGARGFQNELIGSSTGQTEDFGVKAGLFGERVSLAVSRFRSGQFGAQTGNLAVKQLNPIWQALNLLDKVIDDKVVDTQDVAAKGYELQIAVQPVPQWSVAIFASKNDNRISNLAPSSKEYLRRNLSLLQTPAVSNTITGNGQTVAQQVNTVLNNFALALAPEGMRSAELREWQSSLVTNYGFREGRLRGFGIGGYYRWSSPNAIGYQRGANGVLDSAKPYYGEPVSDTGINLSYSRKIAGKFGWKVQLNVRNLLNNDTPIPTRADQISATDTRPVYRIYRLQQPRTWVVTNTISF